MHKIIFLLVNQKKNPFQVSPVNLGRVGLQKITYFFSFGPIVLRFQCVCALVSLPYGAMGWFLICDCGVSSSYSLVLYRGSYMSAPVLLNLLNELRKIYKMQGLPSFYLFLATSLINSIIQEHEC